MQDSPSEQKQMIPPLAGLDWRDQKWIAIDVETTGKYPFDAEICEVAAVKRHPDGKIETYQSLIKPTKPMSAEVIAIHHISNEMVVDAPRIENVIRPFIEFISDGICVAHHAPFDLGFISVALEANHLKLPNSPAVCTSLLSRRVIPESMNHKLQTLIRHLGIKQGQAHRALDDALACLEVGLKSFEKMESMSQAQVSVAEIYKMQGGPIQWSQFSIEALRSHPFLYKLIEAIRTDAFVQITYLGGSKPGQARTVKPISFLRTLEGDILFAMDPESKEAIPKRYFINKISAAAL